MRSNNSGNGADLNKSRIARRVYIRYLLTLTGFIAAFLLFVYLAWLFCRQFTWYYDDPLYIILGFIKEHIFSLFCYLFWEVGHSLHFDL